MAKRNQNKDTEGATTHLRLFTLSPLLLHFMVYDVTVRSAFSTTAELLVSISFCIRICPVVYRRFIALNQCLTA